MVDCVNRSAPMPCPTPDDRNELPRQDLGEFKRRLAAPDKEATRKRLQELGDMIPKTDGIGDKHHAALDDLRICQEWLKNSKRRASASRQAYTERVALMHEERNLLSSIGLTANLYRVHDPLPKE